MPRAEPSRISAKDRERGAILVITLVLVLVMTIAVVALMYLTKNNVLIASNMAVQSAAQEATDQGLNAVNTELQSLPNWPEIASPGSWYSPLPTSNGVTVRPSAPTASFWTSCASAGTHTCGSLPVTYGPFQFTVEYVMYPSGAMATPLQGSEINQHGAAGTTPQMVRYYVVYVHTARSNGGGLGVTVEAILRKTL